MYSVILCGGTGSRLWPLSRRNFPKQFLKLYNDKSLLQETFSRMEKIIPAKNIFFVTNAEGKFNVFNQIREVHRGIKEKQIIVEPESLNTAPAMALAVKYLLEKIKINPADPIIFLPSDHYIKNEKKYLKLVKQAIKQIRNRIGTIGIIPTRPETGYGYIKKGKKEGGLYKALEFKEKPDRQTAQKYFESGQYVWNGGMYLFNAQTFSQELSLYANDIYSFFQKKLSSFLHDFKKLPSISFDYAVSEKSKNIVIFPGDFGWNDVGSFDSLSEILLQNGVQNQREISLDSKNVFTHSATGKLIVTSGVKDIIVVEDNDSILVQKKGKSEEVRKIVDHLKKEGIKELEQNIIVHRPWGKYEVLIDSPGYKVKKITVYPKSKLSLQMHNRRSEHWVIVKGEAKIIKGDEELYMKENESTFIPVKTKHRLENSGRKDLEIIEVQAGDYLEEDDIVRFDDDYKRT